MTRPLLALVAAAAFLAPGFPALPQDEVRRVIKTAASPSDLPADLYEQIAALMGLEA